jgi:murein DD-endopeptidase MepM/ murein hydrolase activator NlpD
MSFKTNDNNSNDYKELSNKKKHSRIKYAYFVLIVLVVSSLFYFNSHLRAAFDKSESKNSENQAEVTPEEIKLPETKKELVLIESGNTYSLLLEEKSDLDGKTIANIYEAAFDIYDLAQIKAGSNIELIYGYLDNDFRALVYKINSEEELVVKKQESGSFVAEIQEIPYETRVVTKRGEIETSLYEAALNQEIDERAVIAVADAFQWTIDFAMDPRVGDTFDFIYEERYLDGKYVMPGRVLAAKYINDGTPYYVYYFSENEDNSGYFDENGNSVQKMFLKAPVAFKYISSGFTTGLRYVEAFNVSTGHRAIDYAAPQGTPIRSVGDGTISFAGWNGPYGYMVKVRHNGTYSTNYGHMSKIAVKTGNKVKQGDVIGYVGSTGFSTGPHLHYEMVKNGVKINPLNEVLPPGEALKEDSLVLFKEHISSLKEELDK